MSKNDFIQSDLEIIVIVEGISAFTSDTVQGHYSYVSSDIAWDKYLDNIVKQNPDRSFFVNFALFDNIVERLPINCNEIN